MYFRDLQLRTQNKARILEIGRGEATHQIYHLPTIARNLLNQKDTLCLSFCLSRSPVNVQLKVSMALLDPRGQGV